MILGVPRETYPGERRVAVVPDSLPHLIKLGLEVRIESGAGLAAGFTDDSYEQKGAKIVANRAEVFAAEVIAQVRALGANPRKGAADVEHLRSGQIVIGHAEPLTAHDENGGLAERGVTLMAMELIPRITRAQSMDALSSQANLAGYKAVLLAANHVAKIFPMMMTAAGTLKPAKVFIVGAGVAGLQAIATAKRLGAVVSAIDVRPEVKEQVESLGAKFVQPPEAAAGAGGYAKEQTEEEKQRQQEVMSDTVAESDIIVTTAAVPGRKAPVLVTAAMVARMRPGAVIVDIAAERGGNCELTRPDEVIEHDGVTIIGTTNLPSLVAHDASLMYSGNVTKLLQHLFGKEKEPRLDAADEIIAGTMVTRGGEIVHPKVREAMGLPAPPPEDAKPQTASGIPGAGEGGI